METQENEIQNQIQALVTRVTAEVEIRILRERRAALVAEIEATDAKIAEIIGRATDAARADETASPAAAPLRRNASKTRAKIIGRATDAARADETASPAAARRRNTPKDVNHVTSDSAHDATVREKILAILAESEVPLRPVQIASMIEERPATVRDRLSFLRKTGVVNAKLTVGGSLYSLPPRAATA